MTPFRPPEDPESRLVLLAARAARDPRARLDLRELVTRSLDWDRLVRTASQHRMLPIVALALLEHASDRLDPQTLARLRRLYMANTAESVRKLKELLAVLAFLEEAGIRAMPLKGPVLAEALYGDLGLRMSVDLDVLISPTDVPDALRVLAAEGYRPEVPVGSPQMTAARRFWAHVSLFPDRGGTPLELHWRLVRRSIDCSLDLARMAGRARTIAVLGRPVLWPSPEHLFMILCLHGSHHYWGGLELILSVAEAVAQAPDIDWSGLLDETTALGCRRRCLLGSLLAADILGAPLSEEFLRQARSDEAVYSLADEAGAVLFPSGRYWLPVPAEIRWSATTLDTSWRRPAYLVMRILVPGPEDWKQIDLPPFLYPLYYLIRPVRLVAKYLRRRSGPGEAG